MVLLSLVLAAAGSYILVPNPDAAEAGRAAPLHSGPLAAAGAQGGGDVAVCTDTRVASAGAIAQVMTMGALFGCAYAGMEVLIYKHVTDLLAASVGQLAVDVGAMAYASFYNVGNLVGGMVGGALAHNSSVAQVAAVAAVSGVCCLQTLALAVQRALPLKPRPTPGHVLQQQHCA
jgi:hypothetical protein